MEVDSPTGSGTSRSSAMRCPSPRRRPCYGIARRRTRTQIFGHGRREARRLRVLLRKWAFAVVWVTLPFTAGPALADTLDPRSSVVSHSGVARAVGRMGRHLLVALVPRTVTLTAIRIVAPAVGGRGDRGGRGDASPVGRPTSWPSSSRRWPPRSPCLPTTGDEYVNGSSYGDERRFPLRAPAALLLGPIELTWAAVVVGAVGRSVAAGRAALGRRGARWWSGLAGGPVGGRGRCTRCRAAGWCSPRPVSSLHDPAGGARGHARGPPPARVDRPGAGRHDRRAT